MARYLICPDVSNGPGNIQYTVMSNARLRCRDNVDFSSQWIELASQPTLLDITEILQSLSDFDPVTIASFISGYLLFFTLGFIAGTVIKVMRRA